MQHDLSARLGHQEPLSGNGKALPSGETRADGVELRAALAITQRRLDEAVARINTLQERDRRRAEEVAPLLQAVVDARRFAYHDELTGLPNRRLLMDRFNQAVSQAERQHKQIALLFLDVDGFKRINDTFGHAAGDSLLQQVAAHLTACIRLSDTACRYGGDEFIVLLPEIEDGQRCAAAVAQKIRAHLAVPYVVAGTEITLSASIGTAVYPVNGTAYRDLIDVSDREMYRNKPGGITAAATEVQRHRGSAS
jgi:diguanylate cyclase (GGDEF)-like protein